MTWDASGFGEEHEQGARLPQPTTIKAPQPLRAAAQSRGSMVNGGLVCLVPRSLPNRALRGGSSKRRRRSMTCPSILPPRTGLASYTMHAPWEARTPDLAPTLLVLSRDDAVGSVSTTCLVTLPPGLVTTLRPTGTCCMWTTAKRGGIARASAHAGSRARVTSMGGLYDAATLHALLGVLLADTAYQTTMT